MARRERLFIFSMISWRALLLELFALITARTNSIFHVAVSISLLCVLVTADGTSEGFLWKVCSRVIHCVTDLSKWLFADGASQDLTPTVCFVIHFIAFFQYFHDFAHIVIFLNIFFALVMLAEVFNRLRFLRLRVKSLCFDILFFQNILWASHQFTIMSWKQWLLQALCDKNFLFFAFKWKMRDFGCTGLAFWVSDWKIDIRQ